MSCRITRKSNGVIDEVFAPNGENSLLYEKILKELPNDYTPDKYVQDAMSKNLIRDWNIDVVYSGVFFNINELVEKYPQVHPNLYSHHSTIQFKPSNIDDLSIGETTNIKIIGRLTTDKIDVLLIENDLVKDRTPHITLSTAKGISPSEANAEIANNQDKVVQLDDVIQGTYGYNNGKKDILSKEYANSQEYLERKKELIKENRGKQKKEYALAIWNKSYEPTFDKGELDKNGESTKVDELIGQFQLPEYTPEIQYILKAINILQSEEAIKLFKSIEKNKITGANFWKKLAESGIPKNQLELLKQYNTTNREELITNMLADYSYTIEINTAKNKIGSDTYERGYEPKQITDRDFANSLGAEVGDYFVEYITEDGNPDIRTFKTIEEANRAFQSHRSADNSSIYSNLTVPGGTNYTENEIATPLITPSIKGHAQFSTDNGIGWFRSDEQSSNNENKDNKKERKIKATDTWREVYRKIDNDLLRMPVEEVLDFIEEAREYLGSDKEAQNKEQYLEKLNTQEVAIKEEIKLKQAAQENNRSYIEPNSWNAPNYDGNTNTYGHVTSVKALYDIIFGNGELDINYTQDGKLVYLNKGGEGQAARIRINGTFGLVNLIFDAETLKQAGIEIHTGIEAHTRENIPLKYLTKKSKKFVLDSILNELDRRGEKLTKEQAQKIAETLGYSSFEELQKDLKDIKTGLEQNNNSVSNSNNNTKTRRILELQSDLFQKGRDKEDLTTIINSKIEDWKYKASRSGINIENGKIGYNEDSDKWYIVTERSGTKDITLDEAIELSNGRISKQENNKGNQFLQLLNKDNNWITFFIKSIIQDSAKKGYEKVLFPSGNTASKVEGHTTLEEFKKQKEDRINKLEQQNSKVKSGEIVIEEDENYNTQTAEQFIEKNNNEINQLKQELERIETEGFGALKPIYNFYENTVTNILKKQGYNPVLFIDEFGNTWNEVTIEPKRDLQNIVFSKFNQTNSNFAYDVLIKLQKLSGISFVLKERLFDNLGNEVNAYVKNGVIFINKSKFSNTSVYHEYFHLFTDALLKLNPELYNSLLKEAKNNKSLWNKIMNEAKDKYDAEDLEIEVFVESLARSTPSKFQEFIGKIIFFFKYGRIPSKIDVSKLSSKTTIQDLYTIINSSDRLDLNETRKIREVYSEGFDSSKKSQMIDDFLNYKNLEDISIFDVNDIFNLTGKIPYHNLGSAFTQGRYTASEIMNYHAELIKSEKVEEIAASANKNIVTNPINRLRSSTTGEYVDGPINYTFTETTPIIHSSVFDASSNFDNATKNNGIKVEVENRSIRFSNKFNGSMESDIRSIKDLNSYNELILPFQKGVLREIFINEKNEELLDELYTIINDSELLIYENWSPQSSFLEDVLKYSKEKISSIIPKLYSQNSNEKMEVRKQILEDSKIMFEELQEQNKNEYFKSAYNLAKVHGNVQVIVGFNSRSKKRFISTFTSEITEFTENSFNDYGKIKYSKFNNVDPNIVNEPSSMKDMIDQLKIQLQERMRLLNTRIFNDDYNTFAANVKLKKMQNALDSLPELEAIVFYIEDANENLAKAHATLKKIIENKDLTIKAGLKKMVEIFQLAQIYEDVLNRLSEYITVEDEELYKITSSVNDSTNTLQRKLATAIENRQKIEKYFFKEGISRMAKILAQSANGKPLAVIKRIEKLEARILREKDISKKAYLEKQLNSIKSINYGDEESIRESLKFASKDVSLFEYLTIPLTSSTDTTLASFALKLKNVLEESRLSLQDDVREARQKLEEYIEKTGIKTGNTAKLYEGMYEDINEVRVKKLPDGKYEIIESTYKSFTNPNDLNKYYRALKLAYETYNETFDKKVLVGFYKKYTQAKPLTEIYTLISYYDKLLEDGVITQEDFDEYIIRNVEADYDLYTSHRSGEISSTQFALALISNIKQNPSLAMRDFAIPRYSENENYTALRKDEPKFEFYSYIVDKHLKSQESVPTYQRLDYRLPSIRKSGKDRIIEGEVWDLLRDSFKVDFGEASDDYERYGLQETDSSRSKTIPVMYVQKMDVNEVSLDLLSSVLRETAANSKYEALMNARPEIDTFTALINNREVAKTNSEGQGVLNKLADKIGIEDYVIKHEKSYGAAMLDAFIDNVVFGKEKKAETFRGVKVDKLIDSLSRYAAFTQLGGIKLILNASNYINARIQLDIEAKSREFFKADDINFSRIETNKYLAVDFMKDFSQPFAKSFVGNLIEIYDPLQGNYTDQFGREVSSQLAKKLFSTNTWFIGQNAGEFSIALQTMLAGLHATKIDGKSLYDIHKEEFESKGKIDFKQDLVNNTRNKLHEILKEMNGVYNSFDRVAAKQYTIGRMILMYRNFIPMGVTRRFGSLKYNKGKESLSEGYYITFFRTLFKDFEEMVKLLNPLDKSNSELSDTEIQNIKKALTELMWIGGLGVLSLLLNSLDWDDDEDNLIKGNIAYLNLKLLNELRFYIWPESVTQILSNPTALFSIIKRFSNLFTQVFDITEEYKRDAGIWSKGDNKFLVRFLQILGINGYMFTPDYAIEIMRKAGV